MKFFVFILTAFLLHNYSFQNAFAQSSEFADIDEQIEITADSPSQAREKSVQAAIENVVARFAVDLIGDKEFAAKKNLINLQAQKDSGKFAPVVKAEILETKGKQYKVAVNLKVSPQSLRQMLEKTGVLSSKFDSGVALPFVAVIDQVRAKTHKWWVNENLNDPIIRDVNKKFIAALRQSLRELNFYVVDPVEWNFKNSLPSHFQKDYYKKDDYQFLESYFKFPLVIKGQIDIAQSKKVSTAYRLNVKLQGIFSSQGKVVAESSREVDLDSGELGTVISKGADKVFAEVTSDLQSQLEGAMRKGIMESSMIQIAVRGDMTYKNLEGFKSTLLKSIGSIRYLSERSIESDRRVYDVDYSGNVTDLSKRIEGLKYPGFKVNSSVSTRTIDVTIKD